MLPITTTRHLLSVVTFGLLLAGCGSSAESPTDAGLVVRDSGRSPSADSGPAVAPPDGAPSADGGQCTEGATRCLDEAHQQACRGGKWVQEDCPSNAPCLDEGCSTGCVDRCNQGETREVGGEQQTCKLYSVAQGRAVEPGDGLHDRARAYNAWLRQYHQPAGGLNEVFFSDKNLTRVTNYGGTGDSALWTGAYLAAEALRFAATGSPEAQANLQRMVEVVHRLHQITGHPGVFCRFAAPLGEDSLVDAMYQAHSDDPEYHEATYQGKRHWYRGGVSRDAHQGMLLGYAQAYRSLQSEAHKEMIRQDIVAMAMELIKERQITINVTFYFGGQKLTLPVPMTLRYVIPYPDEFVDGAPQVQLGTPEDSFSIDGTAINGLREFFPDFAQMVRQVPFIGPLLGVPVPRSGSAMMLASILRLALLVSDGVPAYASQHQAIAAHYDQEIAGWIEIMKLQTFFNTQCWDKYYGLNITFMPLYNLIEMEPDATRKAAIFDGVMAGRMWPIVKDHHNVFFSYLFAALASPTVAAGPVADANAQLAQFRPPPNWDINTDNTAEYGANDACDNTTPVATQIEDRHSDYFIWQKNPFKRIYQGNPNRVWPGVDYLLPYWLARSHDLLQDDAEGTCLRWIAD